jgi:Zn-dependent protease
LFWILFFLMTVVIHEVCHGAAAYALGDPTARRAGRLTLNPLKHIDPFWTVLFPVFVYVSTGGRFFFGMAKPVPVDFSRLRNPRTGMIAVAFAGPASNLVLAALMSTGWKWSGHPFWLLGVYFNLALAFFNLFPVPPLDGSRVLAGFLPWPLARIFFTLERFGFFIVMALYATGAVTRYWMAPLMDASCLTLGVPSIRAYLSAGA